MQQHNKPNTRLAPGDLISVDPSAVRLIRNSKGSLFRESDTKTPRPASSRNPKDSESEERGPSGPPTFFSLPSYAAPWLFVPAYIEPHFKTCSAVYVRHPTARPGSSCSSCRRPIFFLAFFAVLPLRPTAYKPHPYRLLRNPHSL